MPALESNSTITDEGGHVANPAKSGDASERAAAAISAGHEAEDADAPHCARSLGSSQHAQRRQEQGDEADGVPGNEPQLVVGEGEPNHEVGGEYGPDEETGKVEPPGPCRAEIEQELGQQQRHEHKGKRRKGGFYHTRERLALVEFIDPSIHQALLTRKASSALRG
ncbi:MAG: hypothetical protein U5Q44_07420 [Dehalococcoidia bacterium]|nr:hypothetical protein [Dehalococcoidia bacterium]